ncbi:MAG: Uma2 family endonuclease [bacterium]|nr:Uma2 family endonuclease [bacterium]
MECSVAPEVCIEVLSSSNTEEEIADKRSLYFAQGAKEMWICDQDGDMTFYIPGSQVETSELFPSFPANIAYEEA